MTSMRSSHFSSYYVSYAVAALLVAGHLPGSFSAPSSCPWGCTCSSASPSLLSVRCTGPSPPASLPRATTSLTLRGLTTLRTLDSEFFSQLSELRHLDLSYGRIAKVTGDALQSFPHLETLDLSRNELSRLPMGLLAHTPSLKRLLLADNDLSSVALDRPLVVSESLLLLDLSGCGLSQLPASVLSGVPNLRELHVEGNYLPGRLPDSILQMLPHLEVLVQDEDRTSQYSHVDEENKETGRQPVASSKNTEAPKSLRDEFQPPVNSMNAEMPTGLQGDLQPVTRLQNLQTASPPLQPSWRFGVDVLEVLGAVPPPKPQRNHEFESRSAAEMRQLEFERTEESKGPGETQLAALPFMIGASLAVLSVSGLVYLITRVLVHRRLRRASALVPDAPYNQRRPLYRPLRGSGELTPAEQSQLAAVHSRVLRT